MRQTMALSDEFYNQSVVRGFTNRVLQLIARFGPGTNGFRVCLHRWRGVRIGKDTHINYDVIIETVLPHWISIGDRVQIGIRCTIIGHIHGLLPQKESGKAGKYYSVTIEDDAYIGPGAIILPNVTIGRSSVVMAGSVVTKSVQPFTMVQGNPARPVARCGIPLLWDTPLKEFYRKLRPLNATRV